MLAVIVWAALQGGFGQAKVLADNWDSMCVQIRCFFGDCCLFAQEHFGVDAVKVEKAVLEKVDIFIENLQVQFVPNMVKESWWYLKKTNFLRGISWSQLHCFDSALQGL